jgi:hypothetical protein
MAEKTLDENPRTLLCFAMIFSELREYEFRKNLTSI